VKVEAGADEQDRFDQPFPLLRSFIRFILPGLALLLVISAMLTMYGAWQLAEGVYLEQATRRAQVIDRAMAEAAPEPWRRLKNGEAPGPLYAVPDGQKLLAELTRKVRELDLTMLKIYAKGGVIQFDTDTKRIGTVDRSAAYVAAAERGESSVVYRADPDGSALYELYVVVNVRGSTPVVFELYEPVGHLNALLLRAGAAAAGVPSLILLALMLAMTHIVVLAQRNITGRAALVRARTAELKQSYGIVSQQAAQLEAQSADLRTLNQQLESRVAEQVGEIERMGRLRRFLPPQVADLIVSQGAEKQLESHRREITALFCDLRGFTRFSESSDPEDVMALLREYHEVIGRIIYKHGGTLERFAGDGVMVIFNDPVPMPNPALAAVQMALEMREAIGALAEQWKRLGHDLGFGMGIALGYATLGTIGFEGRFDYAAIGTVSNVASRLCDEAKPGQILIAPRVLLAVENAVTVEPVGELTLKGIRRPMLAHNIVGAAMSS
jgi:class 3 adenylate cyclase